MRKRNRFNSKIKYVRLMVIIVIFTCFILIIYPSVRPIVNTYVQSCVINDATLLINETVYNYLQENSFSYSDMATVESDENGHIAAIRVNPLILNQLKTGIAALAAEKFAQLQTVGLKLPIGSLTGSNFFAGKGPLLPLNVSYTGKVQCEIDNLFVTRGINQTQHRIVLRIKAEVEVMSFEKHAANEIHTQITLAETVIVGAIPEIYAGADDEIWPNLIQE